MLFCFLVWKLDSDWFGINFVTLYFRTKIKVFQLKFDIPMVSWCSSQQLQFFISSKTGRGAWSCIFLEVKISHHLIQNYSVQFQLKVALVSSHCLIITMRIKLSLSVHLTLSLPCKPFGTHTFYWGGGGGNHPAFSKIVSIMNVKFCRVLETPLKVLEMLKLFT